MKTTAYNSIRQKIISCEYAPGMYLNEEVVAKDLGLSRTPIRDALGRLEQEGLLEVKSKKGISVAPFTVNTINMIFEVRLMYEPYFILNYGNLIPREHLERLYAIFINSPSVRIGSKGNPYFFEIDNEFHQMIVDACPNIYLRKSYDTISAQNERLRRLTGTVSAKRAEETTIEHLAVLRPCFEDDWKTAAEKLTYHLEQSKRVSFETLINNQNQTIPL